MQKHIQKPLNFVVNNSFTILSIGALIALYAYEITFSTVLFYIFALIGFILTTGLTIIGFAGVLSKGTIDENERLKIKVEKLQSDLIYSKSVLEKKILQTRILEQSLEKKVTEPEVKESEVSFTLAPNDDALAANATQ
jgi:hypothetical protein